MNATQDSTYQEALALQQQTEIPSSSTVGSRLVNDDGIQQALAADDLDNGRVQSRDTVAEDVAKLLSLVSEIIFLHKLKSPNGNSATQGVTTVRRTMRTRLNDHHDILAAKHGTDGVHAARDGLAKRDHIRLDAGPLGAQHAAGAANTSLDLIADEENVVLLAEGLDLGEVVLIGDHNTGLALNGFDNESGGVLAVGLEDFL